ncbi:Aprataxin [Trachymyrmex cornetzi]|uniref:Aprataxin n=1 Tax=Trachymyrmex cornetzi TaxID=471704 RepID=A0A195EGV0_9HYME|nr:Aprataxin [Trachymyrmex cornetzi]
MINTACQTHLSRETEHGIGVRNEGAKKKSIPCYKHYVENRHTRHHPLPHDNKDFIVLCKILIGYHAMPSMQRLHLHVISTDFNSPCLKTKYHWNSFTTPFFLHSQDVCNQLRIDGKIKKISPQACTDYLNTKLKCHKCSTQPKNMPHLKRHLLTHIDNCNERGRSETYGPKGGRNLRNSAGRTSFLPLSQVRDYAYWRRRPALLPVNEMFCIRRR